MSMEGEPRSDVIAVDYLPDDEYMGRLTVAVRLGGFAGIGAAWVDRLEVSRFAEALKAYPLDEHRPVEFVGDSVGWRSSLSSSVSGSHLSAGRDK